MSKKREVKIIITGFANTGKSTVLQIIAEALSEHGIKLNIEPQLDGSENWIYNDELQAVRIADVKKNTTVSLVERPLYNLMNGKTKVYGEDL
jgi:nucleoside-triphosphatase THEP1